MRFHFAFHYAYNRDMEKNESIRDEILQLLLHHLGEKVSASYYSHYADETLPIYVHHAYVLLSSLIGEQKSKDEIDTILLKHSLYSISYA